MDLETILYLIFLAIFLLYRVLKGKQKIEEESSIPQPPPSFDFPKPVPRHPGKDEPMTPQKKTSRRKKHPAQQKYQSGHFLSDEQILAGMESWLDRVETEEGVSTTGRSMEKPVQKEETSDVLSLPFHPREAFLMHILLDRRGPRWVYRKRPSAK
ncbi:MAG: hypothetical protein KatS3mg031_0049 [Chitinophagales bacterium]|nr:MAG: hypothetical protein KatS3mg031_0049 [Chitinophagales bacterium]